jgi:hypothetical protein
MEDLRQEFVDTHNEFSQIPWWFWNDEITEDGIREQLLDFRQQGVYGFTIHARMGLSRSIPYLGERWFELVRFAVKEAAGYGMIVHLYDEGMYPSGSAHGQVVEGHPEFRARGLEMRYIESAEDFKLGFQEKCIAIKPEGENGAIPSSKPIGKKPFWAFLITLSGGTIRGVHEGEDDRQPGAPLAADLLNPEAVRRFIQLTHERYYQELKGYFGNTVQAIFTDEPSIMGRGAKRGLKPWTDGLEKQFEREKGYDLIPLLPALWDDLGGETARIRKDYGDVVAQRFNDSFYQQLSDWCADHDIALTGHPAGSDDIGPLHYFQLPGQDMVWRYIEPEKPSALEGAHSTVGKCSSSAARHLRTRRNGNEVYGAYGWKLNMDEMKWLADWMMVRGVNLFWPHAFYYSIRDFRAYERPPDLGRHNLWWKHYHILANYTKRLCWLLTDSDQVCDIAILARYNHLPWEPAKILFQNQWDFNYLEDGLLEQAHIKNGRLNIGDGSYSMIIRAVDYKLPKDAEMVLQQFTESGGYIERFDPNESELFLQQLRSKLDKDVLLNPNNSDLRYIHIRKRSGDFYYLTNEGENAIEGEITVKCVGNAEWWDPLTGESISAIILSHNNDSMNLYLHLERREGHVLAINPDVQHILKSGWQPPKVIREVDISNNWKLIDPENGIVLGENISDWSKLEGYEDFSGTLIYEKDINLEPDMIDDGKWILNLGEVHDFVEVFCNGKHCGVKLWGPFRFNLPLKEGFNVIKALVTNSMANRMENAGLPSGLTGEVVLEQISA